MMRNLRMFIVTGCRAGAGVPVEVSDVDSTIVYKYGNQEPLKLTFSQPYRETTVKVMRPIALIEEIIAGNPFCQFYYYNQIYNTDRLQELYLLTNANGYPRSVWMKENDKNIHLFIDLAQVPTFHIRSTAVVSTILRNEGKRDESI